MPRGTKNTKNESPVVPAFEVKHKYNKLSGEVHEDVIREVSTYKIFIAETLNYGEITDGEVIENGLKLLFKDKAYLAWKSQMGKNVERRDERPDKEVEKKSAQVVKEIPGNVSKAVDYSNMTLN
jgi:hypothetical protein